MLNNKLNHTKCKISAHLKAKRKRHEELIEQWDTCICRLQTSLNAKFPLSLSFSLSATFKDLILEKQKQVNNKPWSSLNVMGLKTS